ncbi:ACL190Wp [Eremothecium gossypii ATCC 10895]|uniref:ACL190Wp n=1 Tax=Eremothecium gossypii (strain ATCC 10895 / CBS 109.51 / FGSC 9923 / NRRL Y-1056) TaxID=284811 RepID=Q75CV6_EREGS|nr:ACL190Wp [Eremothecium gossypii ATCC 10895]AAS51038.1 ACL190Wp [Eremothecium gossypii ATCC 10895]AEY95328.1 FACL190Wp [Eremothecium gossypii FDAG1]
MSEILRAKVKVALVQLAGSSASKAANLARAGQFIERAMTEQPDTGLVVLPECFNAPYEIGKFREFAEVAAEGPESPSVGFLAGQARRWGVTLVGGTIPELEPDTQRVYNTCLVFDGKGALVGKHRKVHLFDVDIPGKITFTESRTLAAGRHVTQVDTPAGALGVGVCYDLRFPELAMVCARRGAYAMVYPSAFNTTTGPLHWHLLARARSVDNQIYTLLCSPARVAGASYQAYGHSLVVDPTGRVVAEAGEGEEILYATLDPAELDWVRRAIPVTRQRRFDVYADVAASSP